MLEVPCIFEELNSRSKWLALWVISRKKGLSGRKVAEEAGLSWAPAKAALDYLAEKRFVLVQKKGRQKNYFPNEDHFLFPVLTVFFRLLEQVADDFFRELKDFLAPEYTLLAGKVHRHTFYLVFKDKLPPKEKISPFLALKGLGNLGLRLLSIREREKVRKLMVQSGVSLGVSLQILEKSFQKEKLTFFDF